MGSSVCFAAICWGNSINNHTEWKLIKIVKGEKKNIELNGIVCVAVDVPILQPVRSQENGNHFYFVQ